LHKTAWGILGLQKLSKPSHQIPAHDPVRAALRANELTIRHASATLAPFAADRPDRQERIGQDRPR